MVHRADSMQLLFYLSPLSALLLIPFWAYFDDIFTKFNNFDIEHIVNFLFFLGLSHLFMVLILSIDTFVALLCSSLFCKCEHFPINRKNFSSDVQCCWSR